MLDSLCRTLGASEKEQTMRLDKYICECTQLTRSLATRAIKNKLDQVNDNIVKSGSTKIVVGEDKVSLERGLSTTIKWIRDNISTIKKMNFHYIHKR